MAKELKGFTNSVSMLLFSITIVFVFALTQPPIALGENIIVGFYWAALSFTSNIAILRLVSDETNDGAMYGVMCGIKDKSAIVFGKALGSFFIILFVAMVLNPCFYLFFNITPINSWNDLFVTVLSCLGISLVTTFLGFISVSTKSKELVLFLIQLPMIVPLLVTSVTLMAIAIDEPLKFFWLLITYNMVSILLIYVIYPLIALD